MQSRKTGKWGDIGKVSEGPSVSGEFEGSHGVASAQTRGSGNRVMARCGMSRGDFCQIAATARTAWRVCAVGIGFFTDRTTAQQSGKRREHRVASVFEVEEQVRQAVE